MLSVQKFTFTLHVKMFTGYWIAPCLNYWIASKYFSRKNQSENCYVNLFTYLLNINWLTTNIDCVYRHLGQFI